jgi:hypothetical protein
MKYTGRCENDFSVHADLGWWRRPPGGRTGTAAFNQVSNTQASERPAIQARNVGAELISLGINHRPWNILKSPKTTTNVVWTRRLTPPWNPKPKLKALQLLAMRLQCTPAGRRRRGGRHAAHRFPASPGRS